MKIKKGHTGRFINRSRTGSAVLFGVLLVFALAPQPLPQQQNKRIRTMIQIQLLLPNMIVSS